MIELSDQEIDAALERGRVVAEEEPRALAVRFEPSVRRVVLDLTNACTFAFPVSLAQGLDQASDEQLAQIEILGSGYGLHWPALDIDLTVVGLLSGEFGTRSFLTRGRRETSLPDQARDADAAGLGRRNRVAGS